MITRPHPRKHVTNHASERLGALQARSHWRRLCRALLLALVIFSISPTPPAHAQVAADTIVPINPQRSICTNRTVTYRVQVATNTRATVVDPIESTAVSLTPGLGIVATTSDASIGIFTGSTFTLGHLAAANGTVPDTAELTFQTNDKEGTVVLTFGAVGFTHPVMPALVSVKVKACDYRVLVVSRWLRDSQYGTIEIMASTGWAKLPQTDPNSYYGSAVLHYVSTLLMKVKGCKGSSSVSTGNVTLTGTKSEGWLEVGLMYSPSTYQETIPCIRGTGGSEEPLQPDDIRILTRESGGTAVRDQGLSGMNPSHTYVYVKVDKK